MLIIKNLVFHKNNVDITFADTDLFETKTWEKLSIPLNKAEMFISIMSGEWKMTNNCHHGFWKVNKRIVSEQAIKDGISFDGMLDYYLANTGLFFDTYGELYNLFWDNYENFKLHKRKIKKIYI